MRNPYRIEPPFYISFSGGRTSGFMLRMVLDAWGGSLPSGGHVIFANTGREHQSTLGFVKEVGDRWCPVTWVEYVPADPKYRIVDFNSASRAGEPFEALITKKNYLPNPIARFCTSDLKVKPMVAFMRGVGYEDFTTVVGLRADEHRRVAKLRGDTSRDIAMPLADAGVTKEAVLEWWSKNDFDLRLPNGDQAFGNCDLCYLKNRASTERVMQHDPSLADWWIRQEQRIGGRFRKDRPDFKTLLTQVTIQGQLFPPTSEDTEPSIPCDCTE